MRQITFIICAILVVGCALAADHIVGETVTETFTHAKAMGVEEPYLPAYWTLCAVVGKTREQCKYGGLSLSNEDETDRSKWWIGSASSTDGVRGLDCYHATTIRHYTTWDGTRGTEYACLEPPAEDGITIAELGAISDYAQRLNNKKEKTLLDHRAALQIKGMAAWIAKLKG